MVYLKIIHINITVCGPAHTCIAQLEARSVSSTVARLLNRILHHLQVTKQTTLVVIINTRRTNYGEIVPYTSALCTKVI